MSLFPDHTDERVLDAVSELHTPRLELLPIVREHAPLLFPVLADPRLYEYTGGDPPASVEAVARRFAVWEGRRAPDGSELWLNWLVRERASGEATGYVQATLADGRADLAWVLGTRWQGRGYASEAAAAVKGWLVGLGVARFRAAVKPTHRASQGVASRLGMRRTEAWIDGEEVWVCEVELPRELLPSR